MNEEIAKISLFRPITIRELIDLRDCIEDAGFETRVNLDSGSVFVKRLSEADDDR